MIIYKITNKLNGKIYIGQTQNSVKERWRDHCTLTKSKHKSLIRLAIAKYGQESFLVETIDNCKNIDELNVKEQNYITKFNTISPNGYNLDSGGNNKIVHADTRKKMSLAKIGKSHPHTEVSKAKLSKSKIGIKFSAKHKLSLSAARADKKRVRCLQNLIIYESFSAAAKALQITVQRVSQCANGKRKTAHGYSFEVVIE